jgi:pectate lyase
MLVRRPGHRIIAMLLAGCISSVRLLAQDDSESERNRAPEFKPSGFSTVSAYGMNEITGGAGGAVIEVRTAQELREALERRDIRDKAAQHDTARIVKVVADIDLGELANEPGGEEIKNVGKVQVRSNTTLFAPGEGVTIRRGIIDVHGAGNVIIRNLKFRDLWEDDPSGKYDRYGWDYVRITNAGKEFSHHIWVDHCDFGKCYDGQLDIVHGSDLVTVSWCRFSGDERGPHHKSILIGHSSNEAAAAIDRGRLNVTLHHNWFENILDRAPRVRFGNVHAYNNLVEGAEKATISVAGAVTLVENCVYQDTFIATSFSHGEDSVSKGRGGTMCIVNSYNFQPRTMIKIDPDMDPIEVENNFKSNAERENVMFNAPAGWKWENRRELPYAYSADPVDGVSEMVRRGAGTGRSGSTD